MKAICATFLASRSWFKARLLLLDFFFLFYSMEWVRLVLIREDGGGLVVIMREWLWSGTVQLSDLFTVVQ